MKKNRVTEINYIEVGAPTNLPKKIDFLYNIMKLKLDEPHINISHLEVPTIPNHIRFIQSRPYRYWFIISINKKYIGSVYITKSKEIGLYIMPKYRTVALETIIINKMIELGGKYMNVNPKNEERIKTIKKINFKLIQYTYKLDKK